MVRVAAASDRAAPPGGKRPSTAFQGNFIFSLKILGKRRWSAVCATTSGCNPGFQKREPDVVQIDQATRSAQYLVATICP
jgi:hypothetical protein